MAEFTEVRLEAPETNLTELSFAESSAEAINEWAAALPLANTSETANQLTLATAELALLVAAPVDKFAYLESVRPLIHYICTRLDRSNLTTRKSIQESHAQRLLLNLCNGYKGVVIEAIADLQGNKKAKSDLVARAIHRLVSDLSRILLRTLQLYVNPPANFWWELNELFRLSENFDLAGFKLADDENHTGVELSIEGAYLRALLINSCKPNQLKQNELNQAFNAMENWTDPVRLAPTRSDSLLVVDLCANAGPMYNSMAQDLKMPRGLHTEILAYEIEAYLNDVDGHMIMPAKMNPKLLRHLCEAWSLKQERAFGRFATNTPVRVAVGLGAAHYFLSGGVAFHSQISNTEALLRREINPFLEVKYEADKKDDADPWSKAQDLKVRIPINPNIEAPERILLNPADNSARSFNHHETRAIDSSPGGYRLEWLEDAPSNAAVGEIVALREEKSARWCVAVVRWLRQQDKQTFMGVELLSPRAIPVALRAIQKLGGPTDYARGLLLPTIDAIGQDPTIIAPIVPFISKQKINIQRQGIQTTAQLLESQRKTESFNQFTFRMLDGYLENSRPDSTMSTLSAMTREDTSQGS